MLQTPLHAHRLAAATSWNGQSASLPLKVVCPAAQDNANKGKDGAGKDRNKLHGAWGSAALPLWRISRLVIPPQYGCADTEQARRQMARLAHALASSCLLVRTSSVHSHAFQVFHAAAHCWRGKLHYLSWAVAARAAAPEQP